MPIQVMRDRDAIVIKAEGKLVEEDFSAFTPRFEALTQQNEKIRVLFDMSEFEGWSPSGLWEEIKFDLKHYGGISRLAVIGATKWHHTLVNLTSPFAAAEMRYFDRHAVSQARAWLSSP